MRPRHQRQADVDAEDERTANLRDVQAASRLERLAEVERGAERLAEKRKTHAVVFKIGEREGVKFAHVDAFLHPEHRIVGVRRDGGVYARVDAETALHGAGTRSTRRLRKLARMWNRKRSRDELHDKHDAFSMMAAESVLLSRTGTQDARGGADFRLCRGADDDEIVFVLNRVTQAEECVRQTEVGTREGAETQTGTGEAVLVE